MSISPQGKVHFASNTNLLALVLKLKGIFHTERKIQSSFTYKLCLCSVEHKRRYSNKMSLFLSIH